MEPHSEARDDFGDLSAEILQLRAALRALEPEDVDKLGDGLRRLRETLAALEQRLLEAAGQGNELPSRQWRASGSQALAAAEAGYHAAHAALAAEESVEARERCTQAILAYDKLLAMFPPPSGG